MTPKLKEAARTINELAKKEEDARLSLCKAIAGAMELVKKESNLSWREWAEQHLRRPDGSKWSMWTLYTYASFGRDPKKLGHAREAVARHGKNARKALREARREARQMPPQSQTSLDRQVGLLLFAWKNASPMARKLFLEKIAKDQQVA